MVNDLVFSSSAPGAEKRKRPRNQSIYIASLREAVQHVTPAYSPIGDQRKNHRSGFFHRYDVGTTMKPSAASP